ncbi:Chlorophyllase [Dillenia turbinata]|uniref:Chlorophyllase n=1 Tax=Dillenia turbinata TaxID=194707 RepID=A0AAN8VTK6_9MAGN
MALLDARPKSKLTTNVFEVGKFEVTAISVGTSSASTSPPKPLFIVSPILQGTYPVVLFLHGFCLKNQFYNSVLQHVASHGYILVAPQLYLPPIITSGTQEIEYAAEVTNWLAEGLPPVLPTNVHPDFHKLGLSGHSRGGKAAFALALGLAQTSLKLNFAVLIGVDPVAGTSKDQQILPVILKYVPKSFNINIPVAVIGTGLGPEAKYFFPSCAPNGLNHEEFFNESKPPRCHFVTSDYGHIDMLDDDFILDLIKNFACVTGKGPRDPMRKCVGGIMVAFMGAYLSGESEDLKAIVKEPEIAPVKLDSVEFDEE